MLARRRVALLAAVLTAGAVVWAVVRWPLERAVVAPDVGAAGSVDDEEPTDRVVDVRRYPLESEVHPSGSYLAGRVRDSLGSVVSGAHLRAAVYAGGRRIESVAGYSDGTGDYFVRLDEVARSSPPSYRGWSMRVVCFAPGFVTTRRMIDLAQSGNDGSLRLVVDVVLDRGITMVGRVLTARGQPADGLDVRITTPSGKTQSARTIETGEFFSAIEAAGPYSLRVSDARHGHASHVAHVESPLRNARIPDLVLLPSSRLECRVQLGDGSPAPLIKVWLRRISRDDSEQLPAGETRARVATGLDGRITLTGMVPGTYRLDIGPSLLAPQGTVVEPIHVRCDVPEQAVTLPYHLLAIRVQGAHGNDVPVCNLRFRSWSEDASSWMGDFSAGSPLPEDIRWDCAVDHDSSTVSLPSSLLMLPDSWWWITARCGEQSADRVICLSGSTQTSTILQLTRPSRTSRLRIASDADVSTLRMRVVPIAPGSDHDPRIAEESTDRRVYVLSSGHYEVAVEGAGGVSDFVMPYREEVVLAPGEDRLVEHAVRRGGRVKLTLTMNGDVNDQLTLSGFRVQIESMDGGLRDIGPWLLHSESGWRTVRAPKDGDELLCSRLIEPGSYRVVVSADGVESSRSDLQIVGGSVSAISVVLYPK